MKVLLNYAHPLTEAAKARLELMVCDVIVEVVVPVQLDFEQPLAAQLQKLIDLAPDELDYLIPPSLSFAAAVVCAALASMHDINDLCLLHPIVVMKREGLNSFMPSEII